MLIHTRQPGFGDLCTSASGWYFAQYKRYITYANQSIFRRRLFVWEAGGGGEGGREGGREQAVDRAVRCAPSADVEDANLARVIQLLFGQVNFYIPNGIIT